jgi:hypothetical protein
MCIAILAVPNRDAETAQTASPKIERGYSEASSIVWTSVCACLCCFAQLEGWAGESIVAQRSRGFFTTIPRHAPKES